MTVQIDGEKKLVSGSVVHRADGSGADLTDADLDHSVEQVLVEVQLALGGEAAVSRVRMDVGQGAQDGHGRQLSVPLVQWPQVFQEAPLARTKVDEEDQVAELGVQPLDQATVPAQVMAEEHLKTTVESSYASIVRFGAHSSQNSVLDQSEDRCLNSFRSSFIPLRYISYIS